MDKMQNFARDNADLIGKVCELMGETSPQTGEQILLWCVGLSMGLRQQPLTDSITLEILATAWQVGVRFGE